MGTMTLSEFRSELLFDLKNRSDTTDPTGVSTTRQNLWINSGYLHVTHPSVFRHREFKHSYTIALVDGTHTYTFTPTATPYNITAVRYVTHVQAATDDPTAFQTKLRPQDEQWMRARSFASGGPPRDYAIVGDQIVVSPIPGPNEAGQVIVVGAWREPSLLVADGNATVISSMWDEIVLLAARWRAELHLGYRELAEATKLDFASLINEYEDFDKLHGEDWDWMSDVRSESAMERA